MLVSAVIISPYQKYHIFLMLLKKERNGSLKMFCLYENLSFLEVAIALTPDCASEVCDEQLSDICRHPAWGSNAQVADWKLEKSYLGYPTLTTFHYLKAKWKISRKSDAPRREFFEAGPSWADYKTNQPFIKQAIMYLTIWINIIHANIIYVKYILELLCTIFSSSKSSDQKCTYLQ